ncbi:FAD-linked oxidase C-terminal domain-containing protein [Thermodesulfobacteriota bacterium]
MKIEKRCLKLRCCCCRLRKGRDDGRHLSSKHVVEFGLMRGTKKIFDPNDILDPGKII